MGQDLTLKYAIAFGLPFQEGVIGPLCFPSEKGAKMLAHSLSGQSSLIATLSKVPRYALTLSSVVSLVRKCWSS